jgi:hypothetical protein
MRSADGTTMGRVTAEMRHTAIGTNHMRSVAATVLTLCSGRSISKDADANSPASANRVRELTTP